MSLPPYQSVPTYKHKNPHTSHEVELMDVGKRLAFVPSSENYKWNQKFILEPFDETRMLVYRNGDQVYAQCFKRAYRMHAEGKISANTAHARCGLLLGYEKSAIRSFLQRLSNLR